MNIIQLCSQQQYAFVCNTPFVKSFVLYGSQFNQNPLVSPQNPGNSGLNPPVDQPAKFPQVPEGENQFGPPAWQTIPEFPNNNSIDKPQLPNNENLNATPTSEEKPVTTTIKANEEPQTTSKRSPYGPRPSETQSAQPTQISGTHTNQPPQSETLSTLPTQIQTTVTNVNSQPEKTSGPSNPDQDKDTCYKASLKSLIGSTYNPKTKEFAKLDGTVLKTSVLPSRYRVIGPKNMDTMEYDKLRVNIHYKSKDGNNSDDLADGIVDKITCG